LAGNFIKQSVLVCDYRSKFKLNLSS